MEPILQLRIQRLLVPLDGSRLAESSLPAATALAARLGARVMLLHVLERRAPTTVHGQRHLSTAVEAEAYLAALASGLANAGVTDVERHVHPNPEENVAASIATHAAEFRADLILLCAHGHGGVRGWLTGTLAQRVIRWVTTPVLLIRPSSVTGTPRFTPDVVIVALDGTPEGETAVPAALGIAAAFDVALRLVVVVATLGTVAGDRAATALLTPTATTAALDLEEEAAAEYLARLAARLRAGDVPVATEVRRGDAVQAVTEVATHAGRSILTLATHGRAGLDALWAGSVGSRLVTQSSQPLLLVHPQ